MNNKANQIFCLYDPIFERFWFWEPNKQDLKKTKAAMSDLANEMEAHRGLNLPKSLKAPNTHLIPQFMIVTEDQTQIFLFGYLQIANDPITANAKVISAYQAWRVIQP